ncbi:hypothetical protein [Aggregatilinea lenta]|uniref:hypothetical protein n=1 Tax=Aggregatilinea lenta TaxID=913108 RepID=UPI000E5A609E|nr:hypothetical protein [Aggregatilinea lenta]
MPLKRPIFRWETQSGEPVTHGDVRVTPVARSLYIGGLRAGAAWARPAALLVERDGRTQRITVPDITRRIQMGLVGLGAAFTLVTWAKQSRDRSENT